MVDLNSQELQLLLRQFEKGSVVLFAGAGFSLGARNSVGVDPPLASQLCEILTSECGWKYSGEELSLVYEQAQKHLGTTGLNDILSHYYKDCIPAPWHAIIPTLVWYRIYTTNIDDVIEQSYSYAAAASFQKLVPLTCPCPAQDPDPLYEHLQCVHLHGAVLDCGKGFTFTLEEFAGQTAQPNPWYQTTVDDMYSKSFLFVGTRLNEPAFYHYLALRGYRSKGTPENRAKAFLVAPEINPMRGRQLQSQSIVPIECTADDFFRCISSVVTERIPSRLSVLKNRYPHQISAFEAGVIDRHADLLRQFDLVAAGSGGTVSKSAVRTGFFQGAEPTWEDIENNVDAQRKKISEFLDSLRNAQKGIGVVILVGHAGSGKSTALRRLAYELGRGGHTVYFSKTAYKIDKQPVIDLISSMGERHVYLCVDDAIFHLKVIDEILEECPAQRNLTIVLADRPHVIYPRLSGLKSMANPTILEMPLLERDDCERIIAKLEEFGFLGDLKGKSKSKQIQEFLGRSKKQLLVAMKEATLGRGFNVILANEFGSLSGYSARLAYTIACMAYAHGAPIRRRHLFACLEGTDVEKSNLLASDLREVLVKWKENEEFLCPRHRVIAHQVATETSPLEMRKTAILNLLTQISGDLTPQNISRRTPEFIAYRGIINWDNVHDLFGDEYELIYEIYHELKIYYQDDFLFWLQFGRAEIHFDHFSVAENYLKQSLGIRDHGNFQAHHHLGVLFLKRALFEENPASYLADAQRGEEILRTQMKERGDIDSYPYAALITHKTRILRKKGSPKLMEELEELWSLAQIGLKKHGLDSAMQEAHQEIYRYYLMQAVKTQTLPSNTGAEGS